MGNAGKSFSALSDTEFERDHLALIDTKSEKLTEIKPEEYDFKPMPTDIEKESQLAGRVMVYWDEYRRFWAPALRKGQNCWDYVVGEYFTPSEIQQYSDQDKIVMKVPGLVTKLNALEGMQIAGQRSGIILPVGSEDAPDTEAINHVLKSIEKDNHYEAKRTAAFTDGIVTGYPIFTWLDWEWSWDKGRSLSINNDPWNATLPSPMFRDQGLKDCERIMRIRLMSKQEIINAYTYRKEYIEKHVVPSGNPITYFDQPTFTSDERNTIYDQIQSAQESYNKTGKMYVIEELSFVTKMAEIWVDMTTGEAEMLPEDWDEGRVNQWIQFNPNHKRMEMEVQILWVSASTQAGLLVENRRHWFQKNEFPCECYIARMYNNVPAGLFEFLRGTTKGDAIARTEHLHSLRMINDDLTVMQENSIINANDFTKEKGRIGGVLVTRDGTPVGEAIDFPMKGQRENIAWHEFSQNMQMETDKLSTGPSFEGMAESSQESGKAIEKRNQQTSRKFSPYLNTLNFYDLRIHRKILMMIPTVFPYHKVFRYLDPKTQQPGEVELNKPVEWDWATGAAKKIVNNLSGARYDYVESTEDNSPTAKEYELKVFMEIIRDVLPSAPDASFWPFLLEATPNRMAQEFGRNIQKMMEEKANQPEEPEPMKKSLSITGQDLLHNPLVVEILTKEGYFQQGGQPQQQPQQQQQGAINV